MANKGGRGSTGQQATSWRSILLGGRAVNTNNPFWAYNANYELDHHTGVDFGASTGTPVNVPVGGVVVDITTSGPYGNSVVVKLNDGYYMRFAHLSRIGVSRGQQLAGGTYVGNVGSTGFSTGPHLHLEVMTPQSNGKFSAKSFVDPVKYLNGKRVSAVGGWDTSKAADSSQPAPGKHAPGGIGVPSPTSSTTIDTGGWAKMAKVGFSKKDFYAALSSMFGSIDILLQMDNEARAELGGKSIKQAIDEMVKQKIVDSDRARTLLMETAWFKKYGEDTTKRLIEERQRPGVFSESIAARQAEIEEYLRGENIGLPSDVIASIARNAYVYNWDGAKVQQEIRNSGSVDTNGREAALAAKFSAMGFQLSEAAMDRLAKAAWQYGWTDATLIDEIQGLGDNDITFSGGAIAQGIEDLTIYADDYGVRMNDADIRQYRNDFLDNLGDQRMRDLLQERAAQTYAVFADKIRSGQSTKSLASAYFSLAAQLLETDADSISWEDPLFRGGKAFTGTDEAGKQIQKGLWDFEKEIRQDTRWMQTKNARDEIMGTATGVLKTMGLM